MKGWAKRDGLLACVCVSTATGPSPRSKSEKSVDTLGASLFGSGMVRAYERKKKREKK